mgnify:CR=1 FL=1|tara:strand:- start:5036 stop:5311 length:276 start_codon:yes stop_codon:yes gene_type:complete
MPPKPCKQNTKPSVLEKAVKVKKTAREWGLVFCEGGDTGEVPLPNEKRVFLDCDVWHELPVTKSDGKPGQGYSFFVPEPYEEKKKKKKRKT